MKDRKTRRFIGSRKLAQARIKAAILGGRNDKNTQ